MYYFTANTITQANKNIEALDAKIGGLLCVLHCLTENIEENISYTINGELLRKQLSFVFDKELKWSFDNAKTSYIIFAKNWANTFYTNYIKNKIDLLSCAVFFLRRYGFDRELTNDEIINTFVNIFKLKNYKDSWFFTEKNLIITYNQGPVEENQMEFYINRNYVPNFKSILFNDVIQKSATDIKAAGQIQTLYSGSGIQKCFLLSDEPLDQYYVMHNSKQDSTEEAEIELTEKNHDYNINQLGGILMQMYNGAENKTTAIHMFGLKYGSVIKKNGFTASGIIAATTGISESYGVEIYKGVRIYESILNNEYGIKFYDESDQKSEIVKNRLPALPKRERTRFPLNCILYGAPGTGKTYATAQYALAIVENKDLSIVSAEPRSMIMERYNALVKDGQIVFTTFHQNYGYEDFIQGIRPDVSSAEMNFKSVDGVFKVVADRAMNAPKKDFVIIIDEINRANISKVFGELITLIEEDKRWGEENAICATLPSGEAFAVPNNLYIVGTMNSADKSISLIDTALRRRFEFVEYVPNLKLISDPQLRTVLEKLNSSIVDELNSTDLLVGHSYFMGKNVDDVCDIMNHSIIPLLYEYFFDNEKKVEAQIKKAVEGLNVEVNVSKTGRIKLVKKDIE